MIFAVSLGVKKCDWARAKIWDCFFGTSNNRRDLNFCGSIFLKNSLSLFKNWKALSEPPTQPCAIRPQSSMSFCWKSLWFFQNHKGFFQQKEGHALKATLWRPPIKHRSLLRPKFWRFWLHFSEVILISIRNSYQSVGVNCFIFTDTISKKPSWLSFKNFEIY